MSSRDPILYREPWSLSCTTSEDRLRRASCPVHISIPLHQDYLHPFPVKLSRHKVDRSTSNCKLELTSSNCIYLSICGLSAKGCLQIETVEFTFTCKKQLFCPSSCELFGRNKKQGRLKPVQGLCRIFSDLKERSHNIMIFFQTLPWLVTFVLF